MIIENTEIVSLIEQKILEKLSKIDDSLFRISPLLMECTTSCFYKNSFITNLKNLLQKSNLNLHKVSILLDDFNDYPEISEKWAPYFEDILENFMLDYFSKGDETI